MDTLTIMNGSRPRVSIGVPVYNGDAFLEETLNGLLAQSFSDFEILVSDNGSTDRTEEICRAYAARDTRIRGLPPRAESRCGVEPQ